MARDHGERARDLPRRFRNGRAAPDNSSSRVLVVMCPCMRGHPRARGRAPLPVQAGHRGAHGRAPLSLKVVLDFDLSRVHLWVVEVHHDPVCVACMGAAGNHAAGPDLHPSGLG